MTQVGSRKLKNRLGHYLARVRNGEKLLVTDRGKPVAQMIPADEADNPHDNLETVLQAEAAAGRVRLATRALAPFNPVKSKGKSASRIIIESRR